MASGFHGGHRFGDQLEGLRPDDVHAQDFAVFSSATTLMNPSWLSRMVARLLPANGKLADLHLVALRAGLRFGQPHAADARLGVGAAGDAVAVDGHGRLAGACATATMPSIVATCASCGVPATTSPMA